MESKHFEWDYRDRESTSSLIMITLVDHSNCHELYVMISPVMSICHYRDCVFYYKSVKSILHCVWTSEWHIVNLEVGFSLSHYKKVLTKKRQFYKDIRKNAFAGEVWVLRHWTLMSFIQGRLCNILRVTIHVRLYQVRGLYQQQNKIGSV